MSIRKFLLCSCVAVMTVPTVQAARLDLDINVAPPAPRVEAVPAPRHGRVWAPGYWRWNGRRHVWVAGHWMRDRPGFVWVPDRWDARDGHNHFEPGHWDHR